MKLKITNKLKQPYGLNTGSGVRTLAAGETYEGEFSDAEAVNINKNTIVFDVEGFVAPAIDPTRTPQNSQSTDAFNLNNPQRDANGDTPEMAQMRTQFDASYGQVQGAHEALRTELADIAALFGDDVKPEEVKGKVADLLAQVAKFDGDGNGNTGGSAGTTKLTLAEAVASLDDKKDEHWTQGGKPDLDVLKGLTGGDVKRAEVDALTPPRERKTA